MEACALSQLGYVYDKVLKMKSKAKDYYMRCMQLAKSLQPRNLQSESMLSVPPQLKFFYYTSLPVGVDRRSILGPFTSVILELTLLRIGICCKHCSLSRK